MVMAYWNGFQCSYRQCSYRRQTVESGVVNVATVARPWTITAQ